MCITNAHPLCVEEDTECPGYELLIQTGHLKDEAKELMVEELTLVNDIPLWCIQCAL